MINKRMKPYTYYATVIKVVDGDTIDVNISLGFDIVIKNERIRLMGVDTPEKRTRDLTEKKYGILATEIVSQLCPIGSKVILETELDDKAGKFGRTLGTIYTYKEDELINMNEYLIENHYAVKYYGQSKELIKEAHLANYKRLSDK